MKLPRLKNKKRDPGNGRVKKILVIEDVSSDAELVIRRLRELKFPYETRVASSKEEFESLLHDFQPDLILSDFLLFDFTALDALRYLNNKNIKMPFILVTGSQSEEVAVEVLKLGANDYILKTNLARLTASIQSTLEKWEVQREKELALKALEVSRLRFKNLFDHNIDAVFALDINGVILKVNPAGLKLFKYKEKDLENCNIIKLLNTAEMKRVKELLYNRESQNAINFSCTGITSEGNLLYLDVSSIPIMLQQRLTGTYWIVKDVTDKQLIDSRLKMHAQHLEGIVATQQKLIEEIQDFDSVMNKIVESAAALLDADGAIIAIREGDYLVYKAGKGLSKSEALLKLPIHGSASGRVFLTNTPCVIDESQDNPTVDSEVCKKLGIRAMVVVPLVERGKVFGVLNVFSQKPRIYQEEEVSSLKVLAGFFEPTYSLSNELEVNKILIKEKTHTLGLLSVSESKYRLLAENASDMISIHGTDGVFQYVSRASKIILGFEPNELVGKSPYGLVHPDDLEMLKGFQHSILSVEVLQTPPYRALRADGEYVWIESTAKKVIDEHTGEITHISAVSRDVSIRKHNESLNQRLTRILDTSLAEIYIFHKDTLQLLQFNKTAEVNLGYTSQVLNSMTITDLLADDQKKKLSESLKKLFDGEIDECTTETYFKRKDGSTYPVEVRLNLSRVENPPVFLAMVQNISRRKAAEAELIAAKDKAEEMNRLKSSFLANMSHELRTPMIGVLGYAEILNEELQEAELKNMSNSILKSGNRLLGTLNLILDLSRIEAGKFMVNFIPVDINPLIKEVVEEFRPAAEKRGLRLFSNLTEETKTILADDRMVREILNNLVNNAIKYTQEGSIELEARIENNGEKTFVVVDCIDTGIGIAEDQHAMVFEEFRQVSEGYNRRYEGTGLGLTIAKKFVEKLNGTISMKSKINEGSTFTVKFPLVE